MNSEIKIRELEARLEELIKRHNANFDLISDLRHELRALKSNQSPIDVTDTTPPASQQEAPDTTSTALVDPPQMKTPEFEPTAKKTKTPSNFEKFIGENLVSKLGVLIFLIGIAIGAKYSIDNNLINPLTRIVLGYLSGFAMLMVGLRLRKKFEAYSAALVSGAMATNYLITYFAYSTYSLFSQTLAFALMVLFTVFTVIASLSYNRQIISVFGMVAAYAVPFLLSSGSGNAWILFSFITIINSGILVVAYKKYWKILYYSSFGFSWLIYLSWYLSSSYQNKFITLPLVFLPLFFITFYGVFIADKLVRKEAYRPVDIRMLLLNSFLFFGLGYSAIGRFEHGSEFLGMFTLGNALVHFGVSLFIFRNRIPHQNLIHFISGLALIFATIAIPVELKGNWITLAWAGEALLLFWMGRTKQIPLYEKLAYPVMVLSAISLLIDWDSGYNTSLYSANRLYSWPIINIYFLSSALCIAVLTRINILFFKQPHPAFISNRPNLLFVLKWLLPSSLIALLYFSFQIEIASFFNRLYYDTSVGIAVQDYTQRIYNANYPDLRDIFISTYTLLFLTIMILFNQLWLKNKSAAEAIFNLSFVGTFYALANSADALGNLKHHYLKPLHPDLFTTSFNLILTRYIVIAMMILLIFTLYKSLASGLLNKKRPLHFDYFMYIVIAALLSNELITWFDLSGTQGSNKLGLSILWGAYSVFLIIMGLWHKKKHLRLGGLVFFGITLVKLFLYDISHLSTLAKTAVFLSLGVLLLLSSFLYNKFSSIIEEPKSES
jgi:hypothetical protein